MESGSHFSYTKTLEEQTLVYLSISPPNLSMMLVWNNLADPHLSAFSDFAWFSQTLTLKRLLPCFARVPSGKSSERALLSIKPPLHVETFSRNLCATADETSFTK